MSRPRKKDRRCGRRVGVAVTLGAGMAAALPFALRAPPARAPGVHDAGPPRPVPPGGATLLFDRTGWDPARGARVLDQQIFDALLRMVGEAEHVLYLDFFLWNPWHGSLREEQRALADELADAVLARRAQRPDLRVVVLVDPINQVYGAAPPAWCGRLAAAGVPVIFTDLELLRDSNPLYSVPARFWGRALTVLPGVRSWLDRPRWASPLDPGGQRVSARAMARLLHFKANHRKVAIADDPGGGLRLLVTSLNPADGSAAHDNVGVRVVGEVARDALASELAVATWSARGTYAPLGGSRTEVLSAIEALRAEAAAVPTPRPDGAAPGYAPDLRATWLTEGAVRERLLALLAQAGPGDELRAAIFYLSERSVIDAFRAAAARGARVRMVLDANRDAFGHRKNGVPNRPVAAELTAAARRRKADLEIRWADTHGEQFHPKALLLDRADDGTSVLLAGSANWTRRNLDDLNLEADVLLEGPSARLAPFRAFFDGVWGNAGGLVFTAPYEAFAEQGPRRVFKTWLYRFQERSGLCTF